MSKNAAITLSAAPAAANAAAASFAALTGRLSYMGSADVELVRQAYKLADEAHLGQMRKNGEPYITHPIAVAAQCAEWKLDAQALMAALLHDVMEDCGVSKAMLVERFGSTVAELVDGLTKLDKLQFSTREENQAESFRKMLLAMARDVRVILIKLADRSHNMRTLSDVPRDKWSRTARETLDIYAPIAHRLGLNQTYRELQELSFAHAMPWRHAVLERAVRRARGRRRDLLDKVQAELARVFEQAGIALRVEGREKTLHSIYKKMDSKHLSFAQVTDLYGFRIVVPDVNQCYTALGLLHQLYKPLPGKFKDHIAIPKVNGYQSLHTTLAGPSGVNVEFQIRTEPMHVVAESGVAAHWLYKANEPGSQEAERLGAKWLQSLLDIQRENRDAAEFWDHVKIDLFPDAVYVFTPRSEILSLPRGATVVDFAYTIHSDVGDRMLAARINGEQVALRTELRNGDVVAIETAADASPNPAWLGYARTGRARSKIRHSLRTYAASESTALGLKLFVQALRAEGIAQLPSPELEANKPIWDRLLKFTANKSNDELMTDIGLGKRIASIVAKRLVLMLAETGVKPDALLMTRERFTSDGDHLHGAVLLDGSEGGSVSYASCCMPVPGDNIVGYLGHGEALTVHRDTCATAQKLLSKDRERFIEVHWSEEPTRSFAARLRVTVNNGRGVLARVAAELAKADADISHIDMGEAAAEETTDLVFTLGVRDQEHLQQAERTLKRVSSVLRTLRP